MILLEPNRSQELHRARQERLDDLWGHPSIRMAITGLHALSVDPVEAHSLLMRLKRKSPDQS